MTFLRSVAFNAWFFGVTLLLSLGGSVVSFFAPQTTLGLGILWARLLRGGLRVICGIRVRVVGAEHLPTQGPALIASAHQSAFDTFIWLTLLPRCCYVLKHELLRIPVFGWLLARTGMIAVDREAGSAALRHLLREADRAVAEQRQIVIFPEGTRAPVGAQLPIQPGIVALAARTKLPVIPVATDSGLCWSRRAFFKYPGTITIVVHPPLPPAMPRDALIAALAPRMHSLRPLPEAVDISVG
ncbi:MAG: 1-acyl-sn-glycerol-3-phosphate acyltransferase [Proteobacteria bacterium]|nr:1-acyl-sn-glycerol-3-phosphate acyltransferase [Pseudomonadota bacterium]